MDQAATAAETLQAAMMPANLMMPPQIPSSSQTNGNGNGAPPQPAAGAQGISADEIALYDRQIRLWGMKAQERIRSANILLITIKALANEIAKNLVLAGIGSLTIVDHEPVTEADLGAQFFLSAEDGHLGVNRAEAAAAAARRLNPRVTVHADPTNIRTKPPSFFAPFDIVIATDLDPDALNVINTATRLNGRPFYAAGSHGLYGFIFADLIEHDYAIERAKSNVTTQLAPETRTLSIIAVADKTDGGSSNAKGPVELVTKRELYSTWFLASDAATLPAEFTKSPRRLRAVTPALPCLRALWEFQQLHDGRLPSQNAREDLTQFTVLAHQKHTTLGLPQGTLKSEFLRSFLQNVGSEVAPVAAVLGGQLAQDVINVLGGTQQPIQNMVVFDGESMEASMYPLHPEGALGKQLLSAGVENLNGMGMTMGGALGVMPAMAGPEFSAMMQGALVDLNGAAQQAPQQT